MIRSKSKIALLITAALFSFNSVAAPKEVCDPPAEGSGSTLGTIVGGVAGALVGSQIGKGNGRIVGAVAGGAGGAYLGNKIGSTNPKANCRIVDDGNIKSQDSEKSLVCSALISGNPPYEKPPFKHHIQLDVVSRPESDSMAISFTRFQDDDTTSNPFHPEDLIYGNWRLVLIQGGKQLQFTGSERFVDKGDGSYSDGNAVFVADTKPWGQFLPGTTLTGTASHFPKWFDLNKPIDLIGQNGISIPCHYQ